jgi:hypothetical protein
VPRLPRDSDITIMDLALMFHLDFHQLQRINTCHMYLQVISVSEIATAKGDKLLSSAIRGVRDSQHPSTMHWPLIPRPRNSFWQTWKLFLQYFTRGQKLMTPLGIWRNSPARVWKWFQSADRVTWEKLGEDDWRCYQPEFLTRRQTRHSPADYSTSAMATPPSISHLFPATIEYMPDGWFTVSVSATRFAEPAHNPQPDLWQHTNPSEVFQDTPTFFQHLISTPLASEECEAIAAELTEKTLVACSDGACDTSLVVSSYATVLASSFRKRQLATVVGPVDGHPALVTSYRAELSGIIATLYIIDCICSYYYIVEGGMTLYCDNRGALKNAFKQIDLIEVAQALITLIPIVISTSWVKGHYKGKDKTYQHTLNEEADHLAGRFQSNQWPHYTVRKPISPPNYKIRLQHDSSIVTAQIKKIIVTQMHDAELEDHIIQKAHWTKSIFHKIHWDAHERAFRRLPRYSQYRTAKLIHSLVHTNRQKSLYYGQSPLCPICNQEEETLHHVFTCPHPTAQSTRTQSLDDMTKTLTGISTPVPVIEAIIHGFTQWSRIPSCGHIRSLTAGSLRGPDAVLTSAFNEQVKDIGWFQFCLG